MKKVYFFVAVLVLFSVSALFAQQRFALVIGNGDYTHLSRLNNPVNDAEDMGAALQSLGFTVDKVLNGSLYEMENAIIRLRNRLSVSRNSYGFLFFAGHAVQSNGVNFLIPVNANIPSEHFLRERAVSVQTMLNELNDAGNELNIVVLDACRDNPFGWARSGNRGLAVVAQQPADSIIVFATAAGSVAADGTGRNGLFTGHLLNHLRTPGLEVNDVFRLTMGDVIQASNNQQRPAVYSQFPGTAFLAGFPSPGAVSVQPAAAQVRQAPRNMLRINGGAFTRGSPPYEPMRLESEGPQHQVTVSSFYMGRYPVTQREFHEIMRTNPSTFRDDNLPVETVTWFDAIEFCNALSIREGLNPAYTISGSGENRIVIWNRDAGGYRLPTEAEWEFAARAGTISPFNTGQNITSSQANYDGNFPFGNNPRGEFRGRTTPVGSFAANPWGLFDMHGNVWELCWDWFGPYTGENLVNPAGADTGVYRIMRGGSWRNGARSARSAARGRFEPDGITAGSIGFRVVRNAD